MGRMEVLVYVFGSTSVSEMCVLRLFAFFLTKRSSSCLKKKVYAVSSAASALKKEKSTLRELI